MADAINSRNFIPRTAAIQCGGHGQSRTSIHGVRRAVLLTVMDYMRNPDGVDRCGGYVGRSCKAPLPPRPIPIFLPVCFLTGDALTVPEKFYVKVAPVAGEPALLTDIAANEHTVAVSLDLNPKNIDRRVRVNLNRDIDARRTRVSRCCGDEHHRRNCAKKEVSHGIGIPENASIGAGMTGALRAGVSGCGRLRGRSESE